jgi:hypothetical protein
MIFLIVFIIPCLIALFGFILLKGITWKEFLLHLGIQVIIALIGMAILMYQNVWYTEIWNSYVTSKQKERVSCEHSYDCNCYYTYSTDSKGHTTSTRHCMTCYEHDYDIDWAVYDNIKNRIEIRRIDRQGLDEPQRWTDVEINDPVSKTHSYKNYLKASNTTVYREDKAKDLVKKYLKELPGYPSTIYDYYKLNRFIDVDKLLTENEYKELNLKLSFINGQLGKEKQCNIIVVLTNNRTREYFDALLTYWQGANKNDIVIVINSQQDRKINSVYIHSLVYSDLVNVKLRDNIIALKTLNIDKLISTIKSDINQYYQRKRMRDFEYLKNNLLIEWWQYMIFIVIGTIVSSILVYQFHKNDPFDEE